MLKVHVTLNLKCCWVGLLIPHSLVLTGLIGEHGFIGQFLLVGTLSKAGVTGMSQAGFHHSCNSRSMINPTHHVLLGAPGGEVNGSQEPILVTTTNLAKAADTVPLIPSSWIQHIDRWTAIYITPLNFELGIFYEAVSKKAWLPGFNCPRVGV